MAQLFKSKVNGAAIVILGRAGFNQEIIHFQNTPRSITDGKNANFNNKDVLGRAEPLKAFTGSSERTISFEMNYFWYDLNGVGSWSFIKDNLDKLKSLTYPQYFGGTTSGFRPSPKVLFYFGEIFKGIPCVVSSVNIQYKDPWVNPNGESVEDGEVIPFQTTASISLAVQYDYNDARGQEQIRYGLDNQYNLMGSVAQAAGTNVSKLLSGALRRVGRG